MNRPVLPTKLWVDDLRPAPQGWVWAKTSAEALLFLEEAPFDEVSLDHDLGGDDTTRRIVLRWCENPGEWPKRVVVHSANPVGREWLEGMISRYKPAR